MIVIAILRLILLLLIMSTYLLIVMILSIFTGDRTRASYWLRRPTIRLFLWMLGIRTIQSGTIPKERVLFIGNHISYLDPFVLVKFVIASPVAKLEVASWPLLGYAVSVSGVIFVKRRSASSLKQTRGTILEALQSGMSVIVYPEGTTGDGQKMLPFRRGIFDLASVNNIPVAPVTIAHQRPEAAFVKNVTFLPHFLKLFSHWKNEVYIHYGEPISAGDGQTMLKECQDTIEAQLRIFQSQIAKKM